MAALSLVVVGCGISRQIQEAKPLGACRYAVGSTDSIPAGYDVQEFRDINGPEDINSTKYTRLGTILLAKNVPPDAWL